MCVVPGPVRARLHAVPGSLGRGIRPSPASRTRAPRADRLRPVCPMYPDAVRAAFRRPGAACVQWPRAVRRAPVPPDHAPGARDAATRPTCPRAGGVVSRCSPEVSAAAARRREVPVARAYPREKAAAPRRPREKAAASRLPREKAAVQRLPREANVAVPAHRRERAVVRERAACRTGLRRRPGEQAARAQGRRRAARVPPYPRDACRRPPAQAGSPASASDYSRQCPAGRPWRRWPQAFPQDVPVCARWCCPGVPGRARATPGAAL